MFRNGYFIGAGVAGTGSGGSSSGSDDIHVDSDGNIIYSPTSSIFIDEESNVFFSTERKNARLRYEDSKIFAEKVV